MTGEAVLPRFSSVDPGAVVHERIDEIFAPRRLLSRDVRCDKIYKPLRQWMSVFLIEEYKPMRPFVSNVQVYKSCTCTYSSYTHLQRE
jgi:hypothetical protein